MESLVQQLLLGLANGMVFALIALGYTMVYGILELINFAHGDLFMLASFLALTLVGGLGLQHASGGELVGGLLLVVIVCALFSAGPAIDFHDHEITASTVPRECRKHRHDTHIPIARFGGRKDLVTRSPKALNQR